MGTLAGHRYLTRAEWVARPPTSPFAHMPSLPTPRLWIHHSGDDRQGAAAVRGHQQYHQNTRDWKDIAYNFLVDDDGIIYEGRGAGIAGGATEGDNSKSHAICLLGNFENRPVTSRAWQATVDLARHGRDRGWWKPTCGGHRDAPGAQTSCPGRLLYNRLPDMRREVVSGATIASEPPAAPEEPDMTPEECRTVVRAENQRLAQYLMTGAGNQAFNPNIQKWMAAATTLPRLFAAVRAEGTDVDEAEIAALVLAGLSPQAIADAIPAVIAVEVVDLLAARLAG